MSDELVKVERLDRVAVITMNRRPVNAMSRHMWAALDQAVGVLADEEIHCAVLTSSLPGIFCAGADLRELLADDDEARATRHLTVTPIMLRLRNAPVPVVCAVNGHTVGAGIAIMAHCDYRIASADAHFSMTEVDRGTAAGGGSSLSALGVPPGFDREKLYTGRRVMADEAKTVNLVDRVAAADQVMPAALELAGTIAAKPRHALGVLKRAVLLVETKVGWYQGYSATHSLTDEVAVRPDTREGIAAFLERREPEYR
jgi:enoyl-CoA hydratase